MFGCVLCPSIYVMPKSLYTIFLSKHKNQKHVAAMAAINEFNVYDMVGRKENE